jgi:hypothetical protein
MVHDWQTQLDRTCLVQTISQLLISSIVGLIVESKGDGRYKIISATNFKKSLDFKINKKNPEISWEEKPIILFRNQEQSESYIGS